MERDLWGIAQVDMDLGVEHARKRHGFSLDNNLQRFQIAIGIHFVRDTVILPDMPGGSRDGRCGPSIQELDTLAIRVVVVNSLFLVPPFA